MKRLDMIANWIYDNGDYSIGYNEDWAKYTIYFRPGIDMHLYYGKTTVDTKRKPRAATVKKLLLAEIKKRLLDKGWYNNGLKRLINSSNLKSALK